MKKTVIGFLIIFSMHGMASANNDIMLPEPQLSKPGTLMNALKHRKSQRTFSTKDLNLEQVSNILWAAAGVNRPDEGKLTAPSAMNWQEIDVYVARRDGLYKYNPEKHALEFIFDSDIRKLCGAQSFTQQAPINLIYVADYKKMGATTKKKDKDFYAAADTGFISQNVYLYCASENLATVVLGWVKKEELHDVMQLEKQQHIILTQPVGYPE